MNRLDDVIRTGLAEAAETVSEPAAEQLADRLTERRGRARRRERVARTVIGAAAVLVALAAATAVLHRSDDGSERVDTALPPADDGGFTAYAPGWHELDTGPASTVRPPSLAWTGREVVIASVLDGTTRPAVFAYSPTRRTWRSLGEVPIDDDVTIAWAGDRLVAIGNPFPATTASVWDEEHDRWDDLGHPPISEAMASSIWGGPRRISGELQLVWTGQRLLDLTHGAALDPGSGRWTTMAMPEDPMGQASLGGFTTPVWDGREVVLAAWTTEPGLAWTATGEAYREIPGLPADIADPGVVHDSIATTVDGRALLVSGTASGAIASFDGRTDTWRREPSMTGMYSGEGCPVQAATVAGRAVAMPCEGDAPAVLGDAGWVSTGPPPFPTPCCGWVDAGGALVVIRAAGGSDGHGAQPPDVRAAVWIPPDG